MRAYDFTCGVNLYSDYREVQGLVIPHSYWIAQDPEDSSFVHRVHLELVEFRR